MMTRDGQRAKNQGAVPREGVLKLFELQTATSLKLGGKTAISLSNKVAEAEVVGEGAKEG